MRLPFVLMPEPDESARGYIVRVANENGVSSNQMCQWLELPGSSKPLTGATPLACELLDVDQATFRAMGFDEERTSWVHGHLLPQSFLLDHRLRLCPACLEERAYHRRIWDLRHVEHCPRHRLPLLSSCPNPSCGSALRWSRWSLTSCFCGEPLTAARTLTVNDCELEKEIYARAGVAGHSSHLPEFQSVPLPEMLELMLFLGRMDQIAAANEPSLLSRRRMFTDRQVMVRGLAIVNAWPTSFDQLASRVRAGRPKQGGVSLQYGSLHRFIEKRGAATFGNALRRAYSDHLAARGNVDLKSFPPFLGRSQPVKMTLVSLGETEARLTFPRQTFNRLMKGPWGKFLKPVDGAGTTAPLFRQADVDDFVALIGRLISFREADRMLGLPIDSTRALISAGLIEAPAKLNKSKVDGSALDRLTVERMLACVSVLLISSAPAVPVTFLSVVNSAIRRGAGGVAGVVRDLMDGRLTGHVAFPEKPGFSGITFAKAQVDDFLARQYAEARAGRMSLPDAATRLSVAAIAFPALTAAGHLPAPERVGAGHYFAVEVVERFAVEFVSLTELVARSGVNGRHLRGRLTNAGLDPAIQVVSRDKVTIFYSRAEAEPTVPKRSYAGT